MYYNLAISPMYPKPSKTTVEVKIDGAKSPTLPYSLIFWGVKSNLAEKIRVNKRVCAVYPGIPGACIRCHLLAV